MIVAGDRGTLTTVEVVEESGGGAEIRGEDRSSMGEGGGNTAGVEVGAREVAIRTQRCAGYKMSKRLRRRGCSAGTLRSTRRARGEAQVRTRLLVNKR